MFIMFFAFSASFLLYFFIIIINRLPYHITVRGGNSLTTSARAKFAFVNTHVCVSAALGDEPKSQKVCKKNFYISPELLLLLDHLSFMAGRRFARHHRRRRFGKNVRSSCVAALGGLLFFTF